MKVNIHEVGTRLSELLKRVESGEEIAITRAGTPIAALFPSAIRLVSGLPEQKKGKW